MVLFIIFAHSPVSEFCVFFSPLEVAARLGIDKEGGDGNGTYLGLPECFSGSTQQLLAFIGEKLNKRLNGLMVRRNAFPP